jgi:glycerol kinase
MNILAIDQGTSSTKAVVVGDHNQLHAVVEIPVTPSALVDGWVEQDPQELLDSILLAGRKACERAGVTIDAVGFANQGETVLAWDRATGAPLTTAITWQDRRAAGITDRLQGSEQQLLTLTGLPLDPYFSAPKLAWIREEGTPDGMIGTSDAWILHHLVGEAMTDVTTASRSLVMDLETRQWSSEACEIFGIDAEDLPPIVDCAGSFGVTEAFGAEVPITGLMVDQQAALYGEQCLSAGDAKCTYGTGAFFLVNIGEEAKRSSTGLSTSVAWQFGSTRSYCVDGQVYTAGSVVSWLIELGFLANSSELDDLAQQVPGTGGLSFVPSLAGLGAPNWDSHAQGLIEGISLSTRPAHLVRAALFGLAAQIALMAKSATGDLGQALRQLKVDGGLTQSAILMQYQADLLQCPVEVFSSPHATALGIAQMARNGLEPGQIHDVEQDVASVIYEPKISLDEAETELASFAQATQRVRDRSAEQQS